MQILKKFRLTYIGMVGLVALLLVYGVVMVQRTDETIAQSQNDQGIRNYTLPNTEHHRRLRHIQDVCTNKTLFVSKSRVSSNPGFYFSSEYNFSYCKVPKAGSSFWTQVFGVLGDGSRTTDSIFGMARVSLHFKLATQFKVKFSKILHTRSVVISRDPYSRLFSAFVDKMFLPLMYRSAIGIVKRQRNIPTGVPTCANDITFQEFLNDILESFKIGKPLDQHWAPIVSLCKPCSLNVFALIKQESFSTDVEYVLKEIGIANEKYKAIQDALHNHRIESTVPGIVDTVLRAYRFTKKCLKKVDVARKIWTAFQIQGYLRDDALFPKMQEHRVNNRYLSDLILNMTRKNPMTSEESKLQRLRALVGAFANVTKATTERLKQAYKQDFILFDYSFEPPSMINA